MRWSQIPIRHQDLCIEVLRDLDPFSNVTQVFWVGSVESQNPPVKGTITRRHPLQSKAATQTTNHRGDVPILPLEVPKTEKTGCAIKTWSHRKIAIISSWLLLLALSDDPRWWLRRRTPYKPTMEPRREITAHRPLGRSPAKTLDWPTKNLELKGKGECMI